MDDDNEDDVTIGIRRLPINKPEQLCGLSKANIEILIFCPQKSNDQALFQRAECNIKKS